MARLQGKTALITGAASGVGRASAVAMAREGANVVLTDINVADGQGAAAEIGDTALFIEHDISSDQSWGDVIAQTQDRFGGLDVLVNNAAILQMANIEDVTLDDWRKLQAVNVEGVLLGCQHAIRAMKDTGGGSIVNMSSLAALMGMPVFCAYSASKGAITAMSRSIAIHCKDRGYNIRCNTVHPDGILTPMVANLMGPRDDDAQTIQPDAGAELPPRVCLPEHVADSVLFLASDESKFVNGCEFRIDNGQMIKGN